MLEGPQAQRLGPAPGTQIASVGDCMRRPNPRPVDAQPLGIADFESVLPLVRQHQFKPYRNYRTLTARAQEEVLVADIKATLLHPDAFAYVAGSGQPSAAVIARRLAWDSNFFGVPMARIEYLLGEEPVTCEAVLQACLEAFRHAGVLHTAARIDVADMATTALLESYGFRLVGGLVTYVARPAKEGVKLVRQFGNIRYATESDGPELAQIAEAAFKGARSRFHNDPHLPRDRADKLYGEWARRCISGEMAETVLVAEGRNGRLLGFLAFRRCEPVSTVSGVPIYGSGLGACRPGTMGAYPGLIRSGSIWAHERGGVAELQAFNNNFNATSIFEAIGFHCRRAEYNFHLWLGDG